MALVGFAAWFALAVWGFASDGYADWLLFVITAFIVMAVSIPLILWGVSRRHHAPNAPAENEGTFRSWIRRDFVTWQDRVKARNAAIEALLPLAAAAFGMTAFAIVLHFTAHGAM